MNCITSLLYGLPPQRTRQSTQRARVLETFDYCSGRALSSQPARLCLLLQCDWPTEDASRALDGAARREDRWAVGGDRLRGTPERAVESGDEAVEACGSRVSWPRHEIDELISGARKLSVYSSCLPRAEPAFSTAACSACWRSMVAVK